MAGESSYNQPLQSLLNSLADDGGAASREIGLEFGLEPSRARAVLASLAETDSLLWLKTLAQLHQSLGAVRPLSIKFMGKKRFRLEIPIADPLLLRALAPSAVCAQQSRLLSPDPANKVARALCQCPGPTLYGSSSESEHWLEFRQAEGSLSNGEGKPCGDLSGVWLEGPYKAFGPNTDLFGPKVLSVSNLLQPWLSLLLLPLDIPGQKPLVPEWPFQWTGSDDDHFPVLWDWESVETSLAGGFSWTIAAWQEPFDEHFETGWEVVKHPVRLLRHRTEMPLLGCYPAPVLERLRSLVDETQSLWPVQARRVFGVSWTLTSSDPSQIFPVIDGVVGQVITLNDIPKGLYLIADATGLKTDLTGLALVRNERFDSWVAEQLLWARQQARAYLPCLASIPGLWAARVPSQKQWRQGQKSWLRKTVESGVTKTFSLTMSKAIRRRQEALLDWAEETR
jgi:hypothetical protein